jgi:hypothetical protein
LFARSAEGSNEGLPLGGQREFGQIKGSGFSEGNGLIQGAIGFNEKLVFQGLGQIIGRLPSFLEILTGFCDLGNGVE